MLVEVIGGVPFLISSQYFIYGAGTKLISEVNMAA